LEARGAIEHGWGIVFQSGLDEPDGDLLRVREVRIYSLVFAAVVVLVEWMV
jgi:hypothetical protein